jgi:hypothetical protein
MGLTLPVKRFSLTFVILYENFKQITFMHYFEIIEHSLCSSKKIATMNLFPLFENSAQSLNKAEKRDLWKIIERKHRIGVYKMGKRLLRKNIYGEQTTHSSSAFILRISVN